MFVPISSSGMIQRLFHDKEILPGLVLPVTKYKDYGKGWSSVHHIEVQYTHIEVQLRWYSSIIYRKLTNERLCKAFVSEVYVDQVVSRFFQGCPVHKGGLGNILLTDRQGRPIGDLLNNNLHQIRGNKDLLLRTWTKITMPTLPTATISKDIKRTSWLSVSGLVPPATSSTWLSIRGPDAITAPVLVEGDILAYKMTQRSGCRYHGENLVWVQQLVFGLAKEHA